MNKEENPQEPNPTRAAVREFIDGTEPIAKDLQELRDGIDEVDEAIIDLLARRATLVRDAARFKKNFEEVPALKRQDVQLKHIRVLAEAKQSSLDGFAELVEKTFRSLISGFVELQKTAIKKTKIISRERE